MKNETTITCPGCHKHCPMGCARCKYGRTYFEKLQKKQEAPTAAIVAEKNVSKKALRWEAFVAKDGLMWHFLSAGRGVKKALRRKQVTEGQLLGLMDDQEQQVLLNLLKRLNQAVGPQASA